MLKWIKLLLSDSSQASVRRLIGFISFIELLIITNVALFTKVALLNVTLIIVAFNVANEADNGITQGEIIVKALIKKFPN